MYELIGRAAGLILVALLFVGFLWGHLPVPQPRFENRRLLFIVGLLFFLMLVMEWASQHQRAR